MPAPVRPPAPIEPAIDTPAIAGGLLDDLRRSNGPVLTELYGWRDSGSGGQLADELTRIAGDGRRVSSIIDYNGSRMYPGLEGQAFRKRLLQGGIDAVLHVPVQKPGPGKPLMAGADHRKVFVMQVDGKFVGWAGGKNFGASFDPWSDVMVRIEGPQVARLVDLHMDRLRELGQIPDEELLELRRLAASATSTPGDDALRGVEILENSPGRKRFGLTDHVKSEMRRAQRILWVESPLNTSPELVDELVAAARRGKAGNGPRDVRLILPAKVDPTTGKSNSPGIWYQLGKSHYKRLIKAGVQVYEQPNMSHQKLLRADDTWTVSSFNFAHRSVAKDYELGIAFTDAHAGALMERKVLRDVRLAKLVSLADAEGGTAMKVFRAINSVLRLKV